jgi:hypothetical protein
MKKFFIKSFLLLLCMLIFSVPVALAQTCGVDSDGDGVYSKSCDLTDQYAKCSITADGCNSPADCPVGECSERGGACADAADCPINICNNGGAACSPDVPVAGVCFYGGCSAGLVGELCDVDSDCDALISECPSYGSPGACIVSQTCDTIAQTCDNVATCSEDKHPTEIACAEDSDCNGICTYTGEPCVETADCSFGNCVTSGSTCITFYTCEENGEACTADADCEETCGYVDNCPNAANSNQEDADVDGTGDVCDADTIYGTILGDVQEGILLNISTYSCGTETLVATIMTNAEGYYALGGLESDSYGFYPLSPDYVFSPGTALVEIPQIIIQPWDFTATAD